MMLSIPSHTQGRYRVQHTNPTRRTTLTEVFSLSAGAMAAGIRDHTLSAVEVVEAHIERIREVNPALNAVVGFRFDQARREAVAAQERAMRTTGAPTPPLLGVPCTIKEFLGIRGMPQSGGILARSHVVAEHDAAVVRRLRRAGAIPLGVTNVPEAGLWHETNNPVYGRTRNPHDLRRTCGGSSGGEAAIIAAGGSPFGLGSDTGGSVRIPAAFCGIAAHKPTGGLVPNTGHFPHPPRGLLDVPMVTGPMARHVGDLELVLEIIAGPDGIDPACRRKRLGAPEPLEASGLTVYPVVSNGRIHPSAEIEAALWKSAKALEDRGARIAAWPGPDLSRAFEMWAALLTESGERYDSLVSAGHSPPNLLAQLLRWPLGRAHHSGGVIALMVIERALGLLPGGL
ncbi:MAG TPA: amidase, partial [Deltaproteobacteria bacterium]|nr:amidase [Deltaproteobacteria bacterium]